MRCNDGHSVWVNSRALALAGITRDTADPPNGTIVRDPKTGEPSGLLKESSASSLVTRLMPKPTREEQRRAIKAAIADGLKVGVTSVTEAAGTPEDFEVFDEARRVGDLSARAYCSLLVAPGFTQRDADRFDAVWKAHPDTPLFKTGIVTMFMDGVIETNTAVILVPYVNVPTMGEPNYARDAFHTTVQMMDRRGWQIMVHALGDGAVRMVLIIDGGGRVVFGSDWPVATIDAMGRVTPIVNRGPRTGGTDQRLSMTSAIDRYTSGPAYASFDEKEKGTIAPGMLADIVVIATDVFANPPASRADIAVQTTVFDGRIVYRAAAR